MTKKHSGTPGRRHQRQISKSRVKRSRVIRRRAARPAAAYRRRGGDAGKSSPAFYAQETWHEPIGRERTKIVVNKPGPGFLHPASAAEIRQRLKRIPARFTRNLEVVQLSRMTHKRTLFPCYGMQWGPNIYLYPLEASMIETYAAPPLPQQVIEAEMYGGRWMPDGDFWRLQWTRDTLKDFYLNNVLIHEIGHVNDQRNRSFDARERYANWFAIEYGYRWSRGKHG